MIKAVGFDLGDTLIEYEGVPLNWSSYYDDALKIGFDNINRKYTNDIYKICESVLLQYNTRVNPRDVEYPAAKIFNEIAMRINCDEVEKDLLLDSFFGFFQQKSVVFQDTIDVLNQIKFRDLKIGVLTDVAYGMPAKYVRYDIQIFNEKVDSIITSAEVGYRKPNPRGFIFLANKLDVSKDEIIYVGNEEKDIIGAKNAGYKYSILINRTPIKKNFGQDFEFSTLTQLLNGVLDE
ncbi:MAG: HAD family hydrolase [Flavobacteriales bacterium]|nr:HAD family hydrolase [Flavobacteriales bacterium]